MTAARHSLPFNTVATLDNIAHFALAYGDDNPLYHDSSYAGATGWKCVVAPPLFWWTAEAIHLPAVRFGAGHTIEWCGLEEHWRFDRPVLVGEPVAVEHDLAGDQRESVVHCIGRSGDDRVVEYSRHVSLHWQPCDPPPVTVLDRSEVVAIRDAQLAEQRRGSAPLDVAAVEAGESLVPRRRGPLTVTDTIVLLAGTGPPPTMPAPLRSEPGDLSFAGPAAWQRTRGGALCDAGRLRALWMLHHVTDWMGDEARVEQYDFRVARPAWEGEVHTVATTVESVSADGRIELRGRTLDGSGVVTADSWTLIATH
jgi:acyl dehydratase